MNVGDWGMQALPDRMANLRKGGLAALRELHEADKEEAEAAARHDANDAEGESAHLLKKKYAVA